MSQPHANERYTLAARLLHWLMAAGFVFMWGCGYTMAELVEEDSPLEELLFDLHIATGVTLAVLLLVRLWVRLRNAPPPLPPGLPPIERIGAHVGHWTLYVFPAIVIAIGWAETNISGHTVHWYGGIPMPALFPTVEGAFGEFVGGWAETLHMWFAYTMLGVAVVHVAGAVKHRIEGNDVLYRMTIGR